MGSQNIVSLPRGHGGGHIGRGGRGHHYGWGKGRHRLAVIEKPDNISGAVSAGGPADSQG
jgi:hypothetical protein